MLGRNRLSVTVALWMVSAIVKICSWNSGARRRRDMTCVTRARVIPSRRAISAWLAIWPDSRRAFHSLPFWRGSTTRGVFGSLAGLLGGAKLTTRLSGARSLRAPMLPFSNAPLGPSDFDRLFAVAGTRVVGVAVPGDVDDAEPDLRLGPPRAGSHTVTFGEPQTGCRPRGFLLAGVVRFGSDVQDGNRDLPDVRILRAGVARRATSRRCALVAKFTKPVVSGLPATHPWTGLLPGGERRRRSPRSAAPREDQRRRFHPRSGASVLRG